VNWIPSSKSGIEFVEMKNLSLTFCLVIAALFGSVGGGFAGSDLPDCIKSAKVWNNCFSTETWENGEYSGERKNNDKLGNAIENLAKVFLENDATQTQQYSQVWHFKE
jgi:hypothetical protein